MVRKFSGVFCALLPLIRLIINVCVLHVPGLLDAWHVAEPVFVQARMCKQKSMEPGVFVVRARPYCTYFPLPRMSVVGVRTSPILKGARG